MMAIAHESFLLGNAWLALWCLIDRDKGSSRVAATILALSYVIVWIAISAVESIAGRT